jgi:ATP-dependent DNA helicase RecG
MENRKEEHKESWKDENLKTLSGFANTDGGVMKIGIKDDGTVVGVKDAKKLLVEIPNTIYNKLGVIPDVDCVEDSGHDIITIMIEKLTYPVAYNGKYYRRSGSTTLEIKGQALERLMRDTAPRPWLNGPMHEVSVSDLSDIAINEFRRMGKEADRLDNNDLELTKEDLLNKLGLLSDGVPTRSAVLLFHPNPQRFFPYAKVRIGRFAGSDILFADIIDGPLILIPGRVIQLIEEKYTIAPMIFKGIYRTEIAPYPKYAVREGIMNSIIHCDYSGNNGIQIKVFNEDILIYNDGGMVGEWTVEKILEKHISVRRNPALAEVFFRAGMAESFGRGMRLIMDAYKGRDVKPPKFDISEYGFMVTFTDEAFADPRNPLTNSIGLPIPKITHIKLNEKQIKVLELLKSGPMSTAELIEGTYSTLSKKTFYWRVLSPLKGAGYIGLTIPDKSRSKKQKYYLISKPDE